MPFFVRLVRSYLSFWLEAGSFMHEAARQDKEQARSMRHGFAMEKGCEHGSLSREFKGEEEKLKVRKGKRLGRGGG